MVACLLAVLLPKVVTSGVGEIVALSWNSVLVCLSYVHLLLIFNTVYIVKHSMNLSLKY